MQVRSLRLPFLRKDCLAPIRFVWPFLQEMSRHLLLISLQPLQPMENLKYCSERTSGRQQDGYRIKMVLSPPTRMNLKVEVHCFHSAATVSTEATRDMH